MFHYDNGLKLTSIDLAIDCRRRQPRGFISHAHADHMARHQTAFCTPSTARLYKHRLGPRHTIAMPFRTPRPWKHLQLTTYPAGHVLGSAMLLADDGTCRLLYTGDFRLRASLTAEAAELPGADVLVMETTFGNPRYRFPPRDQVVDQLLELIRQAWRRGATPVVHAYTLGKAQEVTRILTQEGIPVRQHPLVAAVSRIYEACGCSLGDYSCYEGHAADGRTSAGNTSDEHPASHSVLVMPPRGQRSSYVPLPARRVQIALTGWAMLPAARYRLGVDHALPLSDHADFDELLECIERVGAKEIYCTHGPASFVDHLQQRGFRAYRLGHATQLRLNGI